MATTTTIYPDADSYIRQDQASTNFGSATLLNGGLSGSQKRHIVMKFDVSGYTPADIVDATLTLGFFRSAGSSTHTMTLARLNQEFVGSEVTYDDASDSVAWTGGAGAAGNAAIDEPTYDITVGFATAGDQTADIKELVIDAINKRGGILWLIVCFKTTESPSGTGNTSFYSVNYGVVGDRPTIDLKVAARVKWTGTAGDGNLETSGNWSGLSAPTTDDFALFNTTANDASIGALTCKRIYIGKNYQGKLGTASSLLAMNCDEFHLSSPHADAFINLNSAASSNTELRVKDTNSKQDSIIIDGKYDATLMRTRSSISLMTDDVTLINALSRVVTFTCDNDVTTIRLGGASAVLDDGGGTVTMVNGSTVLNKDMVNNDGTNFYIHNSVLKQQSSEIDQIHLYSGVVTFQGNEGGPPLIGGATIYGGLFNARTKSATIVSTSAISMRGGRFITDGAVNAAPA